MLAWLNFFLSIKKIVSNSSISLEKKKSQQTLTIRKAKGESE